MKKKLRKKAAFDMINQGMLAFLTFVLVVLLTVLLISQVKTGTLSCTSSNSSVAMLNGTCYECEKNVSSGVEFLINTSAAYFPTDACVETDNFGNNRTATEFGGAVYNATKDMQEASLLPPQFAQILVIALIITAIIGMLAFGGAVAYQRMRR